MDEAVTKDPLSLRERDRVRGVERLRSLARTQRLQATDAERVLWQHLRGRYLKGFKFRRQVVIGPYIVDFVCLNAKLIIEADGGQHAEQDVYDARRTALLETLGYRVIRFWNHEILKELHSVLEQIHSALIEVPSPQPSPGGRGS
jgi:very-short-patch-repair endonuclease